MIHRQRMKVKRNIEKIQLIIPNPEKEKKLIEAFLKNQK